MAYAQDIFRRLKKLNIMLTAYFMGIAEEQNEEIQIMKALECHALELGLF